MPDNFTIFNKALEDWFAINQRTFPWRTTADPYKIWVAEIMSHQTQIDRVATHFWPRFIKRFPTIETLSEASWETVYAVWDGLGYYRRGRNVLKTAQILAKHYRGDFPKTRLALEQLPGIGKYTAAAILAFAFDEKIPAIDTNITQIIVALWPNKDLEKTSQALVEASHSGKMWNSAMMDLASYLRAGKPLEGAIASFFTPEVLKRFEPKPKKPRKIIPKKKTTKKHRIDVGIACIWKNGKYLAQTRPEGKSFMGFWEFPGGKREKGENFRDCVKREIREEIGVEVSVRPHFYEEICAFKHVDLCLRFHRAQIQKGTPKPLENQTLKWVAPDNFFEEKFLPTNHNALRRLQKMRT